MMDASADQRLDDLGRLIAARGRMTELQEQIRSLDARLGAAQAYFGSAGVDLALVRGLHERLTAKRRDAAARLDDARRRAREHFGLVAPAGRPAY